MNGKILAVIPARGGSKGVAEKNLLPLLSKPLVAWTIEAAVNSLELDRVLVSTDNEDIRGIALQYGAEVPFLRPHDLAADNVHSSKVIRHALEWLQENENYQPDAVMMLLPTSPFRFTEHIDQAIDLWRSKMHPAVIGVNKVNKHPAAFRTVLNDALVPLVQAKSLNVQRQEAAELYAVNGSLYLTTTLLFQRFGSFHVEGAAPYELSRLHSVDIDSWEDFRIAELLGENLILSGDRKT